MKFWTLSLSLLFIAFTTHSINAGLLSSSLSSINILPNITKVVTDSFKWNLTISRNVSTTPEPDVTTAVPDAAASPTPQASEAPAEVTETQPSSAAATSPAAESVTTPATPTLPAELTNATSELTEALL